VHNFGNGTDGKFPWGGLLFSSAGNIYGACAEGGAYSSGSIKGGTVFEARMK
jgi:hypothetical protein